MVELSDTDLLELHTIVEERFHIFPHVKDLGLLKSIAERPTQVLHGSYMPYNNVFMKAASLMEGIIRMHPFYDGNKRTGLLAAISYLEINGYFLVIPISAVRYTVQIAKNDRTDPKSTMKLIKKIAKWLKKHSAKPQSKLYFWKELWYFIAPIYGLLLFDKLGLAKTAKKALDEWLAIDIYPEYEKELKDIVSFVRDLSLRENIWSLIKSK
ncbi:MAG: type II toxin-antitoxin system death-on-curing family toxin [Candidatus Nitrosotenuis sp.]